MNFGKRKSKRTSKIWQPATAELQALIDASSSFQDVMRELGVVTSGATNRALKIRIREEDLDISGLVERRTQKRKVTLQRSRKKGVTPLDSILVRNSTYPRTHLKKRLIKEELLVHRCDNCDRGPYWQGKPLSLHLDHINGVRDDNRIENLRLLCPNCHSQTPTYGGKGKVVRRCSCGKEITADAWHCMKCAHEKLPRLKKLTIADQELKIRVSNGEAYNSIAKEYGVSQTTVRKRCKKLGIYVNRRRSTHPE